MPPALSNKPEHFTQNVAATNRWAIQVEGDIAALKTGAKNAPNQIAKVIQNETNNGSAKVELQVPPTFTPVDQTVSLPGPLKLDWTPEEPSTFLATLPSSGVAGIDALEKVVAVSGKSATVEVDITPGIGKGEYVLWFAVNESVSINQPGHGWKNLWGTDSSAYANFIQALNVNSGLPIPSQVGTSGGGVAPWVSAVALFAGVPRLVQTSFPGTSLSTSGSTSGTVTIPMGNISDGNSLMVIGWFQTLFVGNTPPTPGASGGFPLMECTDDKGNEYFSFGTLTNNDGYNPSSGATKTGCSLFGFFASGVTGGNVTISLPWSTPDLFTSMGGLLGAFEFTPVKAVKGIPFFRKIEGQPIGLDGDLPLPTDTTLGGVAANEPVSHEWIESINDDGSTTLSQPDFTDLSGNIDVSQMDDGTNASATTFWRGDGVWAAPNTSASIKSTNAGTYVVLATDNIVEFTAGTIVVTLLASSGRWTLTYAGTGTCTINPPGAQTISGFSSILLLPGQSVDIFYDLTNFKIC